MPDGFVEVPPDSTGKKIDTSELTRADGVTVVERQRMVIADPVQAFGGGISGGSSTAGLAAVGPLGLQVDDGGVVLLTQILTELRVITAILAETLNSTDDPDALRQSEALRAI